MDKKNFINLNNCRLRNYKFFQKNFKQIGGVMCINIVTKLKTIEAKQNFQFDLNT